MAACTRPAMNGAVSSRIQMNSSASVATSTLTVPASLRLASRKIGSFALRLRTARSSSVACLVRDAVIAALRPVDQDAMNAGIRRGESVFARKRFDNTHAPFAQLRGKCLHAARGDARGVRKFAVDDQHVADQVPCFTASLHADAP